MSGPPSNIDPGALFAKIVAVPRPHKIIDHPRLDPETGKPIIQIALTPLTEGQLMACRAAAESYARMMLKDDDKSKTPGDSLGYRDLYVNAVFVEFLARACRHPAMLQFPVFPGGSDQIRQNLTSDEVAVLFSAAEIWQSESGPIVSTMSEPEMKAWVDVLAEGASRVPLSALSSEARNDLLLFMAVQLRNYSTGRFSPGSPADGSAPSTGVPDGEGPPPPMVADV
jgi:hypothetical protein